LSLFDEITIKQFVTQYGEIGRTELGVIYGGSKSVGKSRVFENEKPRLLPNFSPITSHLQKVGRTWEKSGKTEKAKGDFNEENQLQRQMRETEGF